MQRTREYILIVTKVLLFLMALPSHGRSVLLCFTLEYEFVFL